MRIKISLYIITFFLFSSFTFGQNLPKKNDDNFPFIKQTTKIDEFGDISEKEFAPKLKKFAEMMRKNYSATGYVIFYNDFNSTPFRKTRYFADAKFESYTNYLLSRSYNPPRLVYIKGGLREKMTTELWIVPPSGEVPKISGAINYDESEKFKLDKLETKYINLDEDETKKSDVEITKPEESASLNYGEELAEVLNQDKSWRAILYFYADKDDFDIQKSQKIIEGKLQVDFKKLDVDLTRAKIIFGGYKSNPQLDIWIVPKNGIEPEAMPDEKIEEN